MNSKGGGGGGGGYFHIWGYIVIDRRVRSGDTCTCIVIGDLRVRSGDTCTCIVFEVWCEYDRCSISSRSHYTVSVDPNRSIVSSSHPTQTQNTTPDLKNDPRHYPRPKK